MVEDASDDAAVGDERDHAHDALAAGADERIGLVDLSKELSPAAPGRGQRGGGRGGRGRQRGVFARPWRERVSLLSLGAGLQPSPALPVPGPQFTHEAQRMTIAGGTPSAKPPGPVRAEFSFSTDREPHAARGREILRRHPTIRQLAGRNPWSALLVLLLVGLQTAAAGLLRDAPVVLVLLLAFAVGAFASHTLWVLIHECAHNLVFRSASWNRLLAILANLPHLLPSAVSFQKYHLRHHAFQGVYELDADLPNRWEARLVGRTAVGKALWLLLFPVFQVTRPLRLKEIRLFDGWVLANIAAQVGYDALVLLFLGPKALLFLGASFFFSVGLHPLGARWIQEHYLVNGEQETTSYYGVLNVPALNVGFHNEHHDFPSVPWNRLPSVRKSAPEAYDTLFHHRSWTRLLLRFLFDRNLSLWSRVVRAERGGVIAAALPVAP